MRLTWHYGPGPKPYFNAEEEHELGQFLKEFATVGFGRTRRGAINIAEAVEREKGAILRKKKLFMDGWWNHFLQHQGDLSLRRGDSTVHVRMDAINKETIGHYFLYLKMFWTHTN